MIDCLSIFKQQSDKDNSMQALVVKNRFRGPPHSGNGGYVGGLFSKIVDPSSKGCVEVTLRSPIPLDVPLQANQMDDGSATVTDGETLIAQMKSIDLAMDVPAPPAWTDVEAVAEKSLAYSSDINELLPGQRGFHPICFCCGIEHDTGLQVCVASVGDQVAAIWKTKESWGLADGLLPIEYLWTAMDCPGQFAYMEKGIRTGMLGRITASVTEQPKAGEELLVTAWTILVEGKKHFAGAAIFDRHGKLYSKAKTVWIGRRD
ncbi:MAG: hypothetical protein ACJAVI_003970 [Candidatus Azotimanducaceae bacterium]|jgi:hypothetical protein